MGLFIEMNVTQSLSDKPQSDSALIIEVGESCYYTTNSEPFLYKGSVSCSEIFYGPGRGMGLQKKKKSSSFTKIQGLYLIQDVLPQC